ASPTYSWVGPNGFTATTKDIYNLEAGEYCLTISMDDEDDIVNCYTINELLPITVTLTYISSCGECETPIECFSNLIMTVTGGNNSCLTNDRGYEYSLDGGSYEYLESNNTKLLTLSVGN